MENSLVKFDGELKVSGESLSPLIDKVIVLFDGLTLAEINYILELVNKRVVNHSPINLKHFEKVS